MRETVALVAYLLRARDACWLMGCGLRTSGRADSGC